MGKQLNSFKHFIGRIFKGLVLICWIVLLTFVVYLAAIGKISNLFFNAFENSSAQSSYHYTYANTPNEFLDSYLEERGYKYNKPPIRYILDALMNHPNPHWEERIPKFRDGLTEDEIKNKTIISYKKLFRNIEEKIDVLVNSDSQIVEQFIIKFVDVVPKEFSNDWENEEYIEVKLPTSVKFWVEKQKERIEDRKRRASLIDVFAILMALGAFGSLTFLTRDFIKNNNTNVATYVFKPILGVFLAISVFIIDMATHSIISESGVLNIKHETLYLLAFAAGFLSDKAYDLIEKKAEISLNSIEKDNAKKTI